VSPQVVAKLRWVRTQNPDGSYTMTLQQLVVTDGEDFENVVWSNVPVFQGIYQPPQT
jgi:hypothetical protein